jgi:TatD DNase family protein
MWIDTHAHIYLEQFNEDRPQLIKRALELGVERIYLPDIDSKTTDSLWSLVAKYPDVCFGMTGLHPCSVKETVDVELEHVHRVLESGKAVAVGEVGLDYYWDKTHIDLQKSAFKQQIEWARDRDLPIVIHSRDSLDDTIGVIEELSRGDLRGIFHCFNGTVDQAKRIMDVGFMMGFGGVVTFKNVDLDDVLRIVEQDAFVIETDAPYLSPVPHRGRRNESSYIPIIGEYIALVQNLNFEEIAANTTRNAINLFHRPSASL